MRREDFKGMQLVKDRVRVSIDGRDTLVDHFWDPVNGKSYEVETPGRGDCYREGPPPKDGQEIVFLGPWKKLTSG